MAPRGDAVPDPGAGGAPKPPCCAAQGPQPKKANTAANASMRRVDISICFRASPHRTCCVHDGPPWLSPQQDVRHIETGEYLCNHSGSSRPCYVGSDSLYQRMRRHHRIGSTIDPPPVRREPTVPHCRNLRRIRGFAAIVTPIASSSSPDTRAIRLPKIDRLGGGLSLGEERPGGDLGALRHEAQIAPRCFRIGTAFALSHAVSASRLHRGRWRFSSDSRNARRTRTAALPNFRER
jgi:hypothetical protein